MAGQTNRHTLTEGRPRVYEECLRSFFGKLTFVAEVNIVTILEMSIHISEYLLLFIWSGRLCRSILSTRNTLHLFL